MSKPLLSALSAASLSGGVMVLTVLLARLAFGNRTPRWVFGLLWDVSLARLLILAEIPSPLSIQSWLPALLRRNTPAAGGKAGVVTVPLLQGTDSAAPAEGTAIFSRAPALDTDAVLAVAWLTVALALAAWFLWSHLRSRRFYAASLPCRDAFVLNWLESHPLRRKVQARTSDRVAAPLTYGLLHPVILLPSGMDWTALSCVLEHEYQHIRRFDTLRKILLALSLCLHWFNPMALTLYVLANRDMELSCDEAVIRSGADRAKYAFALLSLEEQRGRLGLSGSHFSQNALEERIQAMMKQKYCSKAALAAVVGVMSLSVTVFASAAPDKQDYRKDAPETGYVYHHNQAVENDVMILSDGQTGERQFSVDGGATWMSEERYHAEYGDWGSDWQVEWWTAEDYAVWLEEEKQVLQSIIGERGYTGSEGWFVWDQTRVDETIALYEGILEDIKNGALYSKTVTDKDGTVMEDVSLASDGPLYPSAATTYDETVLAASHDTADPEALLNALRAFGVERDADGRLTYNGQSLRTLVDGVPVSKNGYAIRYVYTNDSGTVDAHTLRSVIYRPDGSYDAMGDLIAVAAEGDDRFDPALIDSARYGGGSQAVEDGVVEESVSTDDETVQLLKQYEPWGLSYEWSSAQLSMRWNGKPVHSLYDTETGTWFANSQRGAYLGDEAIDLETIYRDGKLCGLQESPTPHTSAHQSAMAVGSDDQSGQTFEEIFSRYASYGLVYTPREDSWGDLTWNGEKVKSFADLKPDGGAFSYQVPYAENGLSVCTTYGPDGKLTGLREID